MKPTQAQIEADNARLRSALADMIEITKRNSSPEIILTAIRTCASHALTAAAEVEAKIIICPDCKGERRWPGGALCKTCGGQGQITAAAEVGNPADDIPITFGGNKKYAAAEVGRVPQLEDFGFDTKELLVEQCKETMGKLIAAEKRIKELEAAAAEVGEREQIKKLSGVRQMLAEERRSTIERCAQVAEQQYEHSHLERVGQTQKLIAATLRALKDQP